VKPYLKRRTLIAAALLVVCVVLAYGFYSFPPATGPVDVSWITTVERMLEEAKPYPPNNYSLSPAGTPENLNVYLNENGNETLIYFGDGSNLSAYLHDLAESVNVEVDSTVAEYYLGRVMQANKVVSLHYNITLVTQSYPSQRFYDAYFVLEDNLNENLTGKIFVRNAHQPNLGHLSLWAKAT